MRRAASENGESSPGRSRWCRNRVRRSGGTCKNAVISRHIGFVSRAERRSDAAGVRLRALAFQGPVHRRAGDLEQLGQLSDGVLAGGVQFEQVDLPSDG
jgi:hypothetical protein